jgi:putative acyl-CoA dehydrogenase
MCLDVLRSMAQAPGSAEVLMAEIAQAAGTNRRFDAALARLKDDLADLSRHEGQARRLVERLALMLAASLMLRHEPPEIADAYVASRLGGDWGGVLGTLPSGIDAGAIARVAMITKAA